MKRKWGLRLGVGACAFLMVAAGANAQPLDVAATIAKQTTLALKAVRRAESAGGVGEVEAAVQGCYKSRAVKVPSPDYAFHHVVYCMQMDYFGYISEQPFPDDARRPYFSEATFLQRRAALLAATPFQGLGDQLEGVAESVIEAGQ